MAVTSGLYKQIYKPMLPEKDYPKNNIYIITQFIKKINLSHKKTIKISIINKFNL